MCVIMYSLMVFIYIIIGIIMCVFYIEGSNYLYYGYLNVYLEEWVSKKIVGWERLYILYKVEENVCLE